MRLALIYTNLCFKQVFENAITDRTSRSRSAVNSATCELRVAVTADGSCSSRFKVALSALRRAVHRSAFTTIKKHP